MASEFSTERAPFEETLATTIVRVEETIDREAMRPFTHEIGEAILDPETPLFRVESSRPDIDVPLG